VHDAILDAVYELLQKKSVRNLTIEEVANRAGVGKLTIYRWWPSKAALVMDVFEERVAAQFRGRDAATAAATIRRSVMVPIRLLNGFFGNAPIYYRLLVGHEKLDKRFGDALVDRVMAGARQSPLPSSRAIRRRA